MNNILFVADLHLNIYKNFHTILPTGMNSRLAEQLKVADQVVDVGRKNKVDAIIFLGDLFDSDGEYVSKVVYDAAAHVVRQWAAVAPLYLITGNHDIYRQVNLLTHFTDYDNVTVVTEPIQLEGNDCTFTLAGWGFDPPRNPEKTPNILCGHMGFNGCFINPYQQLVSNTFVNQYALYAQIILGHIHKKQIMPPNVIYIGSVMQHDMGDLGDKKGMTLMTPKGLKFIPTIAPEFRRVEVSTDKDLTKYAKEKTEDYYEIVLKSDAIDYIPTSYKERVVEDFEYKTETRLETIKGESLLETTERFIDKANTAVDKERAKQFLRDLSKGVK